MGRSPNTGFRGLRRVFRLPSWSGNRVRNEVDEELEYHLELLTGELTASGMSPSAAREEALRQFGDLEFTREFCTRVSTDDSRARRRRMRFEEIVQDVRFASRALLRSPGYAAAVAVTLAVGIAAITTVFSFASPYFLRPLPYESPEELLQIEQVHARTGQTLWRASLPQFRDWREETEAFDDLSAYFYRLRNLSGGEGPALQTTVGYLTTNSFDLLGTLPAVGRTFNESDTRADLVVLDHGLWTRQFGADEGLIGQSIRLDGVSFTVIGVMPPSFVYPFGEVKAWVPLGPEDVTWNNRDNAGSLIVGRLADGRTLEDGRSELLDLQARFGAIYPESDGRFEGLTIRPMREALNFAYEILLFSSLLLGVTAGFVLIVACTNVASLTLARASTRAKEVAVRASLGAGRARILRLMMTEGFLLAFAGGALGLALTYWSAGLVSPLIPEGLFRIGAISVDGGVLLVTLVVSMATPFLFALLPAVRAGRTDLSSTLKSGGSSGRSGGSLRLQRALVVVQFVVALVMVSGAGLMIRSLQTVGRLDLGFEADRMVTVEISPPATMYPDADALRAFYDQAVSRLAAIPGVENVGTVSPLPLNFETFQTQVMAGERGSVPQDEWPDAHWFRSGADYLDAAGIELIAGRGFELSDPADVVLVNRTLAEEFWGGSDAVGRTLLLPSDDGPRPYTVVGVVEPVQHEDIGGSGYLQIHLPMHTASTRRRFLIAGVADSPTAVINPIREALAGLDPDLPSTVVPMEEVVGLSSRQWLIGGGFGAVFGGVALFLAVFGIYGVMSYTTSQRTHEIGVRLALGAERSLIRSLVVRDGLRLAAIGLVIGLVLALVQGRFMTSFLYDVSGYDPVTFIIVFALFLGAAILAVTGPARRASRVSPVTVLRTE